MLLVGHEHTWFFLPLLVCHVLQQAPCHLAVLPAGLIPLSQYLSCTWKFLLDTVFLMQTHKCQVEGKNHFSQHVDCACANTPLYAMWYLLTCSTCPQSHLSPSLQVSLPASWSSAHTSSVAELCTYTYWTLWGFCQLFSTVKVILNNSPTLHNHTHEILRAHFISSSTSLKKTIK